MRRQSPTIPIIFLTARDSDLDRVSGLRLGAWDYLTKNTTTLDFLPVRISALFKIVESLSTNQATSGDHIFLAGRLKIHLERKQVFWQDRLIDLTLTEFWLLHSLAKIPGHVKSHDQLMEAANVVVTNNAITAHIRRIRDKFREVDPTFDAIRINGKADDWQPELKQAAIFGAEHLLFSTATYRYESLHYQHLTGVRGEYLYAIFLVTDDQVIYRRPDSPRLDLSDHLQIGVEDRQGKPHQYLLSAAQ
ncbi:MAG: hypothetical protein ACD_75C02151G0001, partial [uncultured bacterium]